MCGIAGAWFAAIRPEQDIESLACSMLDAIRHRGPDDGGFAVHSQGFVGNRRLSILDVSAAGNQPFFNDSGALWLVLNGEIYNYLEIRRELEGEFVFRSNSDTEVLLRAYERWGISCVDRLVGMFAFAVWEPAEKKLTLCRDRLGKKPLYYHWNGSRLLFASEIKSLLAAGVPAAPDVDTCADYLLAGAYDHSDYTFFEGVKQVGRGAVLEIDSEGIRERRYWDLVERIAARDGARSNGIVDEYLHLLDEAVRLRMRMDVPFAVMLSGGLDSSILAVMAARYAPSGKLNVMTFRSKDSRYDEGPWADMVLKDRGWKAFSTMIEAADVAAMLPLLLWHQDEPFGGVATLADVKLAELARNNGIYVLLEGQGADETLGGYEYYFAYHLADLENENPVAAREAYRAYASLRNLDPEADFSPMTHPVYRDMSGHSQDGTRSILPETLDSVLLQRGRESCRREGFASRLDGAMYRDLALTKVPRVLRFKDKAHMMYGVELRTPFLDHRLVEMAFAVPAAAKLAHGYTKYCLRQAFQAELPREIAFHVKRQVQTPQREWLRTSLKGLVDEVIHSASFAGRGLFDAQKVRQVYADYVANPERYPNGFFVWQWLMIEWWHRLFVDRTENIRPSYFVATANIRRFPPAAAPPAAA